ncbi:hypothetical protein IAT38_004607 [Cryptococcus sp. DSM 104549]
MNIRQYRERLCNGRYVPAGVPNNNAAPWRITDSWLVQSPTDIPKGKVVHPWCVLVPVPEHLRDDKAYHRRREWEDELYLKYCQLDPLSGVPTRVVWVETVFNVLQDERRTGKSRDAEAVRVHVLPIGEVHPELWPKAVFPMSNREIVDYPTELQLGDYRQSGEGRRELARWKTEMCQKASKPDSLGRPTRFVRTIDRHYRGEKQGVEILWIDKPERMINEYSGPKLDPADKGPRVPFEFDAKEYYNLPKSLKFEARVWDQKTSRSEWSSNDIEANAKRQKLGDSLLAPRYRPQPRIQPSSLAESNAPAYGSSLDLIPRRLPQSCTSSDSSLINGQPPTALSSRTPSSSSFGLGFPPSESASSRTASAASGKSRVVYGGTVRRRGVRMPTRTVSGPDERGEVVGRETDWLAVKERTFLADLTTTDNTDGKDAHQLGENREEAGPSSGGKAEPFVTTVAKGLATADDQAIERDPYEMEVAMVYEGGESSTPLAATNRIHSPTHSPLRPIPNDTDEEQFAYPPGPPPLHIIRMALGYI